MPPAHAQGAAGPPSVSVAKPVVKDIMEWDEFIGRFEAVDQVDIRARVSGYIDKIHFKDGTIVKTGDPLFTIDQRPYRLAVDQADTAVISAQSRLDFATSDLQRAETLSRSGNITEQLLDQRRQNFQTARAELDRSRAALAQARLDLEFTEIKAPIAGRVSRRLVSMGNLVNANETVLTNIVSLDPIHFYFDVDERSYLGYSRMGDAGTRPSGRTNPNQVFVATTDEREPKRVGHMDFVDNRLDPATGTMRGRAVFDNKDVWLTPGLFGRIRIMGSGLYKGILIPDEAIASDQDRRVVYVVNPDNSVAQKAVRPGPRIDGYRVVREGLTGDETIVVNGLMRVRAAGKVTPQPTTLPPVRERNGS
ncbi:MAG TPA: efflux RND transporter periplasmic adaptor subunit [Beijerinckiaceae bacterium]|nr:efflux RND transporter periplasmic adaptor subunit [Beijerinckiaceae bacterium]